MVTKATAAKGLSAWFSVIRPPTLLTGLAPLLVGVGVALDSSSQLSGLEWLVLFVIFCQFIGLQIAANLVNDVKDHETGVDTKARIGPRRASATGDLPSSSIRRVYRSIFALVFALGLIPVFFGGWPVVVLGFVGMACAYFYTAGPKPLSHLGLGELLVFLCFGPLPVLGVNYLLNQEISHILVSLIPGCHAAAMMAINNERDRDQDRLAGKRTLSLRLGRISWLLPYGFLLAPFAIYFYLGFEHSSTYWLVSGILGCYFLLFLLPPLLAGGASYNQALKRSGVYAVLFAALFLLHSLGIF